MSEGWVPVRKGDVYCSPRCGAGCTYAQFEQASEEARALAERLGDGFKPRVWENLGWHYEAWNGSVVMSPQRHNHDGTWDVTGYTCKIYIRHMEIIYVSGHDPRALLREAITKACNMQNIISFEVNKVAGIYR